mgnify:CR=1 FL=1
MDRAALGWLAALVIATIFAIDRAESVSRITKGFMPANEGDALHAAALAAARAVRGAPLIEIGSYCGRSTVWLAAAARESGTVVFAVDHHRGSEENQAGWEHHDPDVVDQRIGRMDTLPLFRQALFEAGLERFAVAVVGESSVVAIYTKPAAAAARKA